MSIQEAALDRALLKSSFRNVPVKLVGAPMSPRNPSIFQMNIQKSPRFGEYFQIWPGNASNEAEVVSVDLDLLQLVLRVKEPRRRYIEIVRSPDVARVEAHARALGGRIIHESRREWRLELWTPEVERRYLCGRDDVHLFIAQVGAGDTVRAAHDALKPDVVRAAEAAHPGSVQRQGEWFFVPPSEEEAERIAIQLVERPGAERLRSPVGAGTHPHVADRVLAIDRRVRTKHREYRRPETYARGLVVHPDHRDVRLDGWRRVIRNAELRPTPERIRWID